VSHTFLSLNVSILGVTSNIDDVDAQRRRLERDERIALASRNALAANSTSFGSTYSRLPLKLPSVNSERRRRHPPPDRGANCPPFTSGSLSSGVGFPKLVVQTPRPCSTHAALLSANETRPIRRPFMRRTSTASTPSYSVRYPRPVCPSAHRRRRRQRPCWGIHVATLYGCPILQGCR